MRGTGVAKRLGVAVLVAVVITASAGVVPLVSDQPDHRRSQHAEWNQSATVADPIPARGTVTANLNASQGSGVVVIDTNHVNEFDRRAIEPLAKALGQLGYTVRFTESTSVAEELEGADAFVVINPGTEFSREEVAAVKDFTDSGGRLLILGEPTLATVSGGFGGPSVQLEETKLTTLGSAYGLTFETRYLYNLQRNDGNYKHILTTPTSRSEFEDIETVTMYSATTVNAKRGRTLLRTVDGTHKDGSDATGTYGVAVRRGNVLAVGDASFLEAGRHNIADNEKFIAHLVAFLVTGNRTGETSDPSDGENQGGPQANNSTA